MRMRDGLGLQINRKNERWGEEGSHGSLHLTKMCQCQSCCHRVRGVCWAREPGHVGGTCRNLRSITLLSIAEFLVLPTFPPYSICPFIQKPHPKLPPQSPPCRFSCHLTYPLKLPQIHFPSLFYLICPHSFFFYFLFLPPFFSSLRNPSQYRWHRSWQGRMVLPWILKTRGNPPHFPCPQLIAPLA